MKKNIKNKIRKNISCKLPSVICSGKKAGFTLIEFLVVFVILAIMAAAAIGSLLENKNGKNLELSARDIASTIRQAQNYALSGKLPDPTDDSIIPCGYAVHFDNSTNPASYRIQYYRKSGSCSDMSAMPAVSDLEDLSSSTSKVVKKKVSLASEEYIYFALPDGKVKEDLGGNFWDVDLSTAVVLTLGTDIIRVCVDKQGRVIEKKGGISCTQ